MSPVVIKGLIAAGGISLGGVGVWQLGKHMEPKTLRQKLEAEGLRFHAFDESQIGNWKELAKKYKGDNNSGSGSNKFEGFTITSDPTDENAKTLRDKCRALAEKVPGGQDEEQDMCKLRDWCVVSAGTVASTTPAAAAVNP